VGGVFTSDYGSCRRVDDARRIRGGGEATARNSPDRCPATPVKAINTIPGPRAAPQSRAEGLTTALRGLRRRRPSFLRCARKITHRKALTAQVQVMARGRSVPLSPPNRRSRSRGFAVPGEGEGVPRSALGPLAPPTARISREGDDPVKEDPHGGDPQQPRRKGRSGPPNPARRGRIQRPARITAGMALVRWERRVLHPGPTRRCLRTSAGMELRLSCGVSAVQRLLGWARATVKACARA
jgi:hypothetical protein